MLGLTILKKENKIIKKNQSTDDFSVHFQAKIHMVASEPSKMV